MWGQAITINRIADGVLYLLTNKQGSMQFCLDSSVCTKETMKPRSFHLVPSKQQCLTWLYLLCTAHYSGYVKHPTRQFPDLVEEPMNCSVSSSPFVSRSHLDSCIWISKQVCSFPKHVAPVYFVKCCWFHWGRGSLALADREAINVVSFRTISWHDSLVFYNRAMEAGSWSVEYSAKGWNGQYTAAWWCAAVVAQPFAILIDSFILLAQERWCYWWDEDFSQVLDRALFFTLWWKWKGPRPWVSPWPFSKPRRVDPYILQSRRRCAQNTIT